MQEISRDKATRLYKKIFTARSIEKRMMIALRQGKISKWFSAWGQEAVSVGLAQAMRKEEYILTMHRNLGVFVSREVNLEQLFAQFQGKIQGFTKGRDRSFHFGSKDLKIVGMISHLGAQMGVGAGISLAEKLGNSQQATLVITGDGGASEGDFHEAVNLAAVWGLPLVILIENNHWGLSTPSSEQFRMKQFTDKGIGYGIEAVCCNGNNVFEVYESVSNAAAYARKNQKPILVECHTFRLRGHEEASGTAYYPEGLIEKWEKKDPVALARKELINNKIINENELANWEEKCESEVLQAWENSLKFEAPEAITSDEIKDTYESNKIQISFPSSTKNQELRFVDAIKQGLDQAMERFPELVLMGQDIAEYGGVFKVTEGLLKKYGKSRVRNTPICEAAVVGAALGMSVLGNKTMMEMQFSDFVTEGFNQIVNNLAKVHYRWGQSADVVIRMPTGGGVAAGPFHSQSIEGWFTQVPGLKVVYPSTPTDAKGLLLRSFEDPNPVLFFEHKKLYRSIKEAVPQGYYSIEIGKAKIKKKGEDLTVVAYGWGVHKALEISKKYPHISIEIIDLCSLLPWDKSSVFESVKKTGKLLLLSEAVELGNPLNEIARIVNQELFEYLDAPIQLVASLNTPVPFHANLEDNFLPWTRFEEGLLQLWKY